MFSRTRSSCYPACAVSGNPSPCPVVATGYGEARHKQLRASTSIHSRFQRFQSIPSNPSPIWNRLTLSSTASSSTVLRTADGSSTRPSVTHINVPSRRVSDSVAAKLLQLKAKTSISNKPVPLAQPRPIARPVAPGLRAAEVKAPSVNKTVPTRPRASSWHERVVKTIRKPIQAMKQAVRSLAPSKQSSKPQPPSRHPKTSQPTIPRMPVESNLELELEFFPKPATVSIMQTQARLLDLSQESETVRSIVEEEARAMELEKIRQIRVMRRAEMPKKYASFRSLFDDFTDSSMDIGPALKSLQIYHVKQQSRRQRLIREADDLVVTALALQKTLHKYPRLREQASSYFRQLDVTALPKILQKLHNDRRVEVTYWENICTNWERTQTEMFFFFHWSRSYIKLFRFEFPQEPERHRIYIPWMLKRSTVLAFEDSWSDLRYTIEDVCLLHPNPYSVPLASLNTRISRFRLLVAPLVKQVNNAHPIVRSITLYMNAAHAGGCNIAWHLLQVLDSKSPLEMKRFIAWENPAMRFSTSLKMVTNALFLELFPMSRTLPRRWGRSLEETLERFLAHYHEIAGSLRSIFKVHNTVYRLLSIDARNGLLDDEYDQLRSRILDLYGTYVRKSRPLFPSRAKARPQTRRERRLQKPFRTVRAKDAVAPTRSGLLESYEEVSLNDETSIHLDDNNDYLLDSSEPVTAKPWRPESRSKVVRLPLRKAGHQHTKSKSQRPVVEREAIRGISDSSPAKMTTPRITKQAQASGTSSQGKKSIIFSSHSSNLKEQNKIMASTAVEASKETPLIKFVKVRRDGGVNDQAEGAGGLNAAAPSSTTSLQSLSQHKQSKSNEGRGEIDKRGAQNKETVTSQRGIKIRRLTSTSPASSSTDAHTGSASEGLSSRTNSNKNHSTMRKVRSVYSERRSRMMNLPRSGSKSFFSTCAQTNRTRQADDGRLQESSEEYNESNTPLEGPFDQGAEQPQGDIPPSNPQGLTAGSGSDDDGGSNSSFSEIESSSDSESDSESGSEDEHHHPLSYQIPLDVLKTALTASPNRTTAYWSHRLYKGPDNSSIPVHYCRNKQQSENALALFKSERVLGFDIEWKPNVFSSSSIKDNASLIQLASESRIALFQLALFKGHTVDEILPGDLKAILENPDIVKVGVSILSDCTRLKKYLGIEARGLIELSHLHKLVKYSATEPRLVNKHLVSLARQVEEHLFLPLSKGAVRESDWSKELNYEQVAYAASDAYAGVRLYDILESRRKQMRPKPPRPAFAELKLPIILPKRRRENALSAEAKQSVLDSDDSQDYLTAAEDPLDDLEEESEQLSGVIDALEADVASTIQKMRETRLERWDDSAVISYPTLPDIDAGTAQPTESPMSSGEALESEVESSPESMGPEVRIAELWTSDYLARNVGSGQSRPGTSTRKISSTRLRAYHLWHHQGLEVTRIATLLRNPPLKQSTVSSYVLDAITWENLAFTTERLRALLQEMPIYVVERRYGATLRRLDRENSRHLHGTKE